MGDRRWAMGDGGSPTATTWVIGLSALGAANMGVGALRQLGIVRHLPDPPIRGFDSNRVMMSSPAFAFGVPDTPIAAASLVANIPLELAARRARRDSPTRWIPVAMAAKSIVDVAVAAWYLDQMRTRIHAWCAYCLLGATINAVLAALTIHQAGAMIERRRARVAGAVAGLAIGAAAIWVMSQLDERHHARRGEHQP